VNAWPIHSLAKRTAQSLAEALDLYTRALQNAGLNEK
jgi:hypothetical protein